MQTGTRPVIRGASSVRLTRHVPLWRFRSAILRHRVEGCRFAQTRHGRSVLEDTELQRRGCSCFLLGYRRPSAERAVFLRRSEWGRAVLCVFTKASHACTSGWANRRSRVGVTNGKRREGYEPGASGRFWKPTHSPSLFMRVLTYMADVP